MSDAKKKYILEEDEYVKGLVHYIVNDFNAFRKNDKSLGAMIICDSSEQARKIYDFFEHKQLEIVPELKEEDKLKAGLILYDFDDKESQKVTINDFKKNNKVDILIVYTMLLTGFDAPRLKRLYIGRKLYGHTLLQAITRVNRPYKDLHHGYLIDFADIDKNFKETVNAYYEELRKFNNADEDDDNETYDITNVLVPLDEILEKFYKGVNNLFNFNYDNEEKFRKQIGHIQDKYELIKLRKDLEDLKEYFNSVKYSGDDRAAEIFKQNENLTLDKISILYKEVKNRINLINQKERLEREDLTKDDILDYMLTMEFAFKKTSEEELKIVQFDKNELFSYKDQISKL
ncbi:UNVERIFIED_CONTAM: hypothetical protein O8I53_10475 [Campylobacter lari]